MQKVIPSLSGIGEKWVTLKLGHYPKTVDQRGERELTRLVKTPSQTLAQRLVVYGLGAGAVSAASSADARVIWSGPVEMSGNTIHFDLQNMVRPGATFATNDDFVMKSDTSKSKAKIKSEGPYSGSIAGNIRNGRPYAFKLRTGQSIGSQNFYSTAYFNDFNAGPPDDTFGFGAGDWRPGQRGFVALRLSINGNNFYGWADVTLRTLTGAGPVFTLHSYAFQDSPNQTIAAGQKKDARRGRAAAIGLFIAGASGVATLRRRKKSLSI